MKPSILSLKKGQRLWAIVEETIAGNELIINFSGDLLRVLNSSVRNFRAGERVQLEVETLSPLQLKLVAARSRSSQSLHFDRTI